MTGDSGGSSKIPERCSASDSVLAAIASISSVAGADAVFAGALVVVEETMAASGSAIPGLGNLGGRGAPRLAEIGLRGAARLGCFLAVGMSLRNAVGVISRNACTPDGGSAALSGIVATVCGTEESVGGRGWATITSTVAAGGEETYGKGAMLISASEDVLPVTSGVSGCGSPGGAGLRKLAGTGLTTLARGFEEVTGGGCLAVAVERTGWVSDEGFGTVLAGPAITGPDAMLCRRRATS